MPLNVQRARALLQGFDFPTLFIEELGWSWPTSRKAAGLALRGMEYTRTPDPAFRAIAERAARLVCTTPEFDDLAKGIFGKQTSAASVGATEFADRAQLRAELDGLVAHLYGLTEDEFVHILPTFPLVPDPVKTAAHNAYRDVERGLLR